MKKIDELIAINEKALKQENINENTVDNITKQQQYNKYFKDNNQEQNNKRPPR